MSVREDLEAGQRQSRRHDRAAKVEKRMRGRLLLAKIAFVCLYGVIIVRLAMLAEMQTGPLARHLDPGEAVSHARPEILDRNGVVLASDIMVPSAYADPKRIIDVDEAVEKITAVLPGLDGRALRTSLSQKDKRFVWVKREITPRQRAALHRAGIPGLGFVQENQRVYPAGRTAAHIVGFVNIDNLGIAGIEKHLDDTWLGALHAAGLARTQKLEPVRLSLDLRVQHAMRDEIQASIEEFEAVAGAGTVIDVRTGEVVAMVSLPDFDPNVPAEALEPDRINRLTTGVYELGSAFKAFTTAMALDSGKVTLQSSFDARNPIRVGRFTIGDYHGEHRWLTVPEVFIHSSNIGTAYMARAVGIESHQQFLRKLGFYDRIVTELPESGAPSIPRKWAEVTQMTISFGHGLSVPPMQAAVAGAALVNGGRLIPPTFLPRSREQVEQLARQVISEKTSAEMRYLMRLNVVKGSGKKADVPGYSVGGKTGTAEKVVDGRYSGNKVLNTFLSTFPTTDPRYLVMVMLDEPKGNKETYGYRTAGWNTAPTTGRIVRRIAPLLGVPPQIAPADGEAAVSVSY
ncbi:peptidoglycan D,D-transpeptidase FtsI family protein [Lutibaculum baratangense]|uniref:Cell division protein n=1 Tax=Lutibaculum baratangense AMV1 TaxID=631454 RepID=V4R5V5_9HYPH|nr:penicillin-binding protein 2 [Lutibaculum baratangense]ESR27337.1 Cell division protein [Lutibaculum baratangense AMV1]